MSNKMIILGAGVAGIGAARACEQNNIEYKIIEQSSKIGGLCGNFVINGFLFDKFIHFSFSNDENFNADILNDTCYKKHLPVSYNFYKNLWLEHPLQDHLFYLPLKEKLQIIKDFLIRSRNKKITNYKDWLTYQFGDYFTEHFPAIYTRKYWGVEASEMSTDWIGKRVHCPSFKQVLKGAVFNTKENYYYAKEMRYPKNGGFLNFFTKKIDTSKISFNKKVVKIDIDNKVVSYSDGTSECFNFLYSSIPLPEYLDIIDNLPVNIIESIKKLSWTQGYMVSVGFKNIIKTKGLWNYIYDEDILASRIYYPHLKSPNNVPKGKSSLQAEIFYKNGIFKDEKEVLNNTIDSICKMNLCKKEDIEFNDIRHQNYANIIFTPVTQNNKKIVIDYLKKHNIIPIGRFGKWEYFWSDQAYMDGLKSIMESYKKGYLNE